jgi:lipase chaperone LimK
MGKFEFQVGVHDGLIVVLESNWHFYAIYGKSQDRRRLLLERRRPTKDQRLVDKARQAANAKARELGWIV